MIMLRFYISNTSVTRSLTSHLWSVTRNIVPLLNTFLLRQYFLSNGQLLIRLAQTGPPNARKRRPVFPPAGRSVVLCTPQMAPRTSFQSRQPDVIASFSFGACTVQTCFQQSPDILRKSVLYDGFSTLYVDIFCVKVLSTDQARMYI